MLFDPSEWLAKFMQLTYMSWDFRCFILILGIGYIALAWIAENYVLPKLGKYIGVLHIWVTGTPKQRKTYKLVLEQMHALQ
jgi:cation-transporting ATPase 13A3/4/5